jgi:hypothetical protein
MDPQPQPPNDSPAAPEPQDARLARLRRRIAHAAAARDRAIARLDELRAELERLDGPETVA